MRVYTIFDDFPDCAIKILNNAGIEVVVHPLGKKRPDLIEMQIILKSYDGVIVGTSQKMPTYMFCGINDTRVIGTASVGIDHINVPEDKCSFIKIVNTPSANAQSVAEYTIGVALTAYKRIFESCFLYSQGKNNKSLRLMPEELCGKTFGVIGAGNISIKIMEYAKLFGLKLLCWTKHPERHKNIDQTCFVSLDKLITSSDIISVNLPNNDGTRGIISRDLIGKMKETAVFISVSRLPTVDVDALIERAKKIKTFYICLDIDVDNRISKQYTQEDNIIITPHIAGGTTATRRRMFLEVAQKMSEMLPNLVKKGESK